MSDLKGFIKEREEARQKLELALLEQQRIKRRINRTDFYYLGGSMFDILGRGISREGIGFWAIEEDFIVS